MSSDRMLVGWLLPAGVNVQPEAVVVQDHYLKIAETIGCNLIDAVYNTVGSDDGEHTQIVGFIDDEGLFDPDAKPNVLASVLFDRQDLLVGDCLVFSSVNADGENDGENYDAPSWLIELSDDLVLQSAELWNSCMVSLMALRYAVDNNVVDESEVDAAVVDDGFDQIAALLDLSLRYAKMRMQDEKDGVETVDLDTGLNELLGEGN